MDSLKEKLKYSYKTAQEAIKKAHSKQKRGYDTKVKGATIDVGDRVLVKKVAFEGKESDTRLAAESSVSSRIMQIGRF